MWLSQALNVTVPAQGNCWPGLTPLAPRPPSPRPRRWFHSDTVPFVLQSGHLPTSDSFQLCYISLYWITGYEPVLRNEISGLGRGCGTFFWLGCELSMCLNEKMGCFIIHRTALAPSVLRGFLEQWSVSHTEQVSTHSLLALEFTSTSFAHSATWCLLYHLHTQLPCVFFNTPHAHSPAV